MTTVVSSTGFWVRNDDPKANRVQTLGIQLGERTSTLERVNESTVTESLSAFAAADQALQTALEILGLPPEQVCTKITYPDGTVVEIGCEKPIIIANPFPN